MEMKGVFDNICSSTLAWWLKEVESSHPLLWKSIKFSDGLPYGEGISVLGHISSAGPLVEVFIILRPELIKSISPAAGISFHVIYLHRVCK